MTNLLELADKIQIPAPSPLADIEWEQALLGVLLVDNSFLFSLPASLTAATFYEPVHERIFAAIAGRIERGEKASPITLKRLLELVFVKQLFIAACLDDVYIWGHADIITF